MIRQLGAPDLGVDHRRRRQQRQQGDGLGQKPPIYRRDSQHEAGGGMLTSWERQRMTHLRLLDRRALCQVAGVVRLREILTVGRDRDYYRRRGSWRATSLAISA